MRWDKSCASLWVGRQLNKKGEELDWRPELCVRLSTIYSSWSRVGLIMTYSGAAVVVLVGTTGVTREVASSSFTLGKLDWRLRTLPFLSSASLLTLPFGSPLLNCEPCTPAGMFWLRDLCHCEPESLNWGCCCCCWSCPPTSIDWSSWFGSMAAVEGLLEATAEPPEEELDEAVGL